ncbi:hypothetical protein HBH98_255840 [Parastagonospora nodorum]|nr:hypothetical protein HBH53_259120 [Parastagonospora nodorum]KAH3955987.1 hypothetical protein HBH51_258910 [Parastagonospora nodorum]KAH4215257.1 hypothetical protein HBI06_258260 [Parastagonospora nodorum]KAH4221305.1 hypothetical protein HBI05_256270 [Parastagonospora nodorum]KAH4331533.1 hypothetical protein HBH98_255840 [Parastagonospora nodorum]
MKEEHDYDDRSTKEDDRDARSGNGGAAREYERATENEAQGDGRRASGECHIGGIDRLERAAPCDDRAVHGALHLLDGRLQKEYNTHQDGLLVGLLTLIDGLQATREMTYGHPRRGREHMNPVHQVGFVAVRGRSQRHEGLTRVWSRSGSNGARGSVGTSEGLRQSMLEGKTVLVDQVIVMIAMTSIHAIRTTRAISLHFAQQSDAS